MRITQLRHNLDPPAGGRYDPFSPLETVLLYSLEGEYLGTGRRYERDAARQQPPQAPPSKPKHSYLDLLIQKH